MATINVDTFIYGGTVPGCIAARTLADLGRTVYLAEWTKEFGGMCVSGVLQVDHVINNSCGREKAFWNSVRAAAEATGFVFDGTVDTNTNPYDDLYPFNGNPRNVSPLWVLTAISQLLNHPNITFVKDIELLSVVKDNSTKKLTSATLSNGNTITFRNWTDYSYEGDLQVMAGIPHEYGRTSREMFGEINGGISETEELFKAAHPVRLPDGNLMRHRSHSPTLKLHEGDLTTMGFNWRFVWSTKANRVPVESLEAPLVAVGYRPEKFADFINEMQQRNAGSIGFLASSHAVDGPANNSNHTTNPTTLNELFLANQYPRLRTKAQREKFFDKMFLETAGRIYAAKTSPLTSTALKNALTTYGLSAEIYQTNYWRAKGWPPQPYIRSAIRARGQRVVTFANYNKPIDNPVFPSGYAVDSHQHYWFHNPADGLSWREGRPTPGTVVRYLLPWTFMLPYPQHCRNGLLGWLASESYVMSCDLRIEPTKMIQGEVAGIALNLAMELGVEVIDVPYGALRERLVTAGIILTI